MSTVTLLAGSVEHVRWPVSVTDDTGAVVNPTGDVVKIAFQPVRSAAPLDWQAAEWVTDTLPTPDTYYARALLGTAPLALAAGVYTVFLQITDAPEVPILAAGTLYVAAAG